jgi:hypothetical protein
MFKVLREHSPMVLASVDIICGTPLLLVSHLRTLQVPKSPNLIPSTVPDTVTDSDILYYPQPQILDTPLLHQPPPMGENQFVVPPWNLAPPDSKARRVVLGGFVWMQVTLIHTHKGTPDYTP